MSFVREVSAAVTGVASECASLGASDESLLDLVHHCAISVRSADESTAISAKKKACCQYLCMFLCAFSTRCNKDSASKIEDLLRTFLKHKIATGLRSNVQLTLTKCMTGNANRFFLTSFAKSLAQELLQSSNESEDETPDAQQNKLRPRSHVSRAVGQLCARIGIQQQLQEQNHAHTDPTTSAIGRNAARKGHKGRR